VKLSGWWSLAVVTALLLVGCGYKPSSHYARQVIGEKVSTEVVISLKDPENTVIIKDAVDAAVIMRFKSSLVSKAASDSHLIINLKTVRFSPIQYDENGYVIAYRTTVSLQITRVTDGAKKAYNVSGYYDFSIQAQAIISDQARFEAIKSGAAKAINSFVAMVASEGSRSQ
jgi:hypothetical protein